MFMNAYVERKPLTSRFEIRDQSIMNFCGETKEFLPNDKAPFKAEGC